MRTSRWLAAAPLLAAPLLFAAAVPASAQTPEKTSEQGQTQEFAADRIVRAVELADLKAVVSSLGHTIVEEGLGGDTGLIARSAEGVNYLLIGTACDVNGVPGCQGVAMQIRFAASDSVTPERLASANFNESAVNIWRNPETGNFGVTRYVVLDYGVTMANLRENVNLLLYVTPGIFEKLTAE